MIRQMSFAQSEFAGKKKTTRREKFLGEMEKLVPWTRLLALLEPYYPRGKRGRPPIGLERMLRIYFLQQWYTLATKRSKTPSMIVKPCATSPGSIWASSRCLTPTSVARTIKS